MLERKAPERVNALREKQISDYEETYRMLSDTELRPSGLVGNTDAERTIGARAMESAKRHFGWPATSCGGDAGELSERSVAS